VKYLHGINKRGGKTILLSALTLLFIGKKSLQS